MTAPKSHPFLRRIARVSELWVIIIGFMLNAAWEFAQSPLYTDHDNGLTYIVWTRLHCTLGDVLILLGSFWVTCILLRTRTWPARKPILGGILFALFGLGYTIWSESFNIGINGAWEYTAVMPTILGIGLTPILQWTAIPPVTMACIHRILVRASVE